MKHINIFQTETDYTNNKDQLNQPQVTYVQDTNVIYCTNETKGNNINLNSNIDDPGEINYENFEELL